MVTQYAGLLDIDKMWMAVCVSSHESVCFSLTAANGRQKGGKRMTNERQTSDKRKREREREREREFSSLLHLEKGGCGRGASVSVLTNNQFIKVTISI